MSTFSPEFSAFWLEESEQAHGMIPVSSAAARKTEAFHNPQGCTKGLRPKASGLPNAKDRIFEPAPSRVKPYRDRAPHPRGKLR